MIKKYTCICEAEFDSPQKFNSHKQGCSQHIISKYGSLEAYYLIKNRSIARGANTRKSRNLARKQFELTKWVLEQHTCEKCGKIMTERYGSGRFCSRVCSNSHAHTSESRLKTSRCLKAKYRQNVIDHIDRKQRNIDKYNLSPKRCSVCGIAISYERRHYLTCGSSDCIRHHQSVTMSNLLAVKGLHRTVPKRYKYGCYNGIFCDSSWELAFVIYSLDKGIPIKRCSEHFQYEINGHRHNYFPDFVIDGVYYEIKNYYTETVYAKIRQFPEDKKLVIIDGKQIQFYINYCTYKYGPHFYTLYDRNCASWMD